MFHELEIGPEIDDRVFSVRTLEQKRGLPEIEGRRRLNECAALGFAVGIALLALGIAPEAVARRERAHREVLPGSRLGHGCWCGVAVGSVAWIPNL